MNATENQEVYLKMLQNIVLPEIKGLSTKNQYWFKKDGATAHTSQQVQEWLETKFQGRIISRDASFPLPARSPDINSLDY